MYGWKKNAGGKCVGWPYPSCLGICCEGPLQAGNLLYLIVVFVKHFMLKFQNRAEKLHKINPSHSLFIWLILICFLYIRYKIVGWRQKHERGETLEFTRSLESTRRRRVKEVRFRALIYLFLTSWPQPPQKKKKRKPNSVLYIDSSKP